MNIFLNIKNQIKWMIVLFICFLFVYLFVFVLIYVNHVLNCIAIFCSEIWHLRIFSFNSYFKAPGPFLM
jgi:hypothetical protein